MFDSFEAELEKLAMTPLTVPGSLSRAAAQLRAPRSFVPRAATPGTFGVRDALKSASDVRESTPDDQITPHPKGWSRTLTDLPIAIGSTALGYGVTRHLVDSYLQRVQSGQAPAPSWLKHAPAVAGIAAGLSSVAIRAAHDHMKRRREEP